jgi:protoporphyrinogen oxidase
MMDATPERALNALLPDLRRPFPRIDAAIRAVRLYRWEHGWTVFRPGYLQHLARLREPGVLNEQPRVALAVDYLVAPNVEGAVVAGLRAGERILSTLEPPAV